MSWPIIGYLVNLFMKGRDVSAVPVIPIQKPISMRDKISLERVNKLHPAIRQEVGQIIDHLENNIFPDTVKIRVVQGLRTPEEQDALYAQGRTKPGKIVTNAKAWKSNHNFGLSFDFCLMYDRDNNGTFESLSWVVGEDFDNDKEADWMEVVEEFKAQGYEWGGYWKFKDFPHLQKDFGYSVDQLYAKVKAKDFIPGTTYVNI